MVNLVLGQIKMNYGIKDEIHHISINTG